MKLYKLLTIITLGVGAVACNDMEQIPTNNFTDANYWTSPERAQNVVNMAYSQMYDAGKFWGDESLSDNVIDANRVSDQRLIRRGMATTTIGLFEQWGGLYGGIKTCHVFLDHINDVAMEESLRTRMTSEIRFARAYIFFRLANLYGAIPFFTKDITLDEANTISRTPVSEVYSFIHTELDDIINTLPSRDQLSVEENGKITKAAAAMLQARVYLMESDWENVAKYTKRIMDGEFGSYDLFPSYAGLFKEANEYNCEVIFDRAYVPNMITWGEMIDMAPLSLGSRTVDRVPTQSLVDTYLTRGGYRIDEAGADYDERNPYLKRDPRMTATIVYDGYKWKENFGSGPEEIRTAPGTGQDAYDPNNAATSKTGYYVAKYFAPQGEGTLNSGLNIITMRYADVLLMYAEAMFEQGLMTVDVWNNTIKPIRRRAGFTVPKALDYPGGDEAAMRRIIRDERRVEFALEGLRWWDIKRWKAGSQYLTGPVCGATFNGTKLMVDTYEFDENRDYLWAVPQSQINLNNNLAPNNPGYSN